MRGGSDGGSGRSTPRGDAELVDFDELEQLEASRLAAEAEAEAVVPAAAVTPCPQRPEEVPVGAAPFIEEVPVGEVPRRRTGEGPGPPAGDGARGEELMCGPRQWEQWFGENCRNKVEAEGKWWDEYGATRFESEMTLLMCTKDLETHAGWRWQQRTTQEGKLGALMTVTAPEFLRDVSSCADLQLPSWRFFTDAMNDLLLKVHRALGSDRDLAESAGLGLRFAALEFLLSQALHAGFPPSAERSFQAVFESIHQPKAGFLVKLQSFFGLGESGPCKDPAAARRVLNAQWNFVAKRVRRLLCCANAGDKERLQEAIKYFGHLLDITGPVEWPEGLLFWRNIVLTSCYRSMGGGALVRTSPVTASWVLMELRAAFTDEEFQEAYQHLKGRATAGSAEHNQMVQLSLSVHRRVLPKHGFQGTSKGVQEMFGEMDLHSDLNGPRMCGIGDRVVAFLRMRIMDALGMVKSHTGANPHEPQFHTVGDSHSMMGWPSKVVQHFQGPLLCHNVGRVKVQDLAPPILEGDALCWCFGEIDCRNQVRKFCTETKTYQDVIDELIARYFQHILAQRASLPQVRIFVFNVPPPQYADILDRCWTAMPYKGTDEERQTYVLYFNQRVRQECSRHAFTFFDVYDHYTDERGFLKLELSDKSVHIANGVHIKEFLDRQRFTKILASHFDFRAKQKD